MVAGALFINIVAFRLSIDGNQLSRERENSDIM
jgi:hypothetical protein